MKRGFSLVELSIVLVILGLLTGGILAGQSLIRASELRAASAEYQRYAAAVNTFRDKYFAIPGDFRDATRFWSRQVAAAHCVTNSAAAVAAPGACDGDGSGLLVGAGAASQSAEMFQFWKHLALAGLVEGSYSGLAGSGGTVHCVNGTNCPVSKLGNGGWYVLSATSAGDGTTYAVEYGNYFELGANSANAANTAPLLKPEEAWNIDTKLDDGRPAYGKVVARYWNNLCSAADDGTHANNDLAASYRLSDSAARCTLIFTRQF